MKEGFEEVRAISRRCASLAKSGTIRIPTAALWAIGFKDSEEQERCFLYYNEKTQQIAMRLHDEGTVSGYGVKRTKKKDEKSPLSFSIIPVCDKYSLAFTAGRIDFAFDAEERVFYFDFGPLLKTNQRPIREVKASAP